MPTCPVFSLRCPTLFSASHHNAGLGSVSTLGSSSSHVLRARKRRPRKAGFATAAAAKRDDATSPIVLRTLTVLHKTRTLLPRILPSETQGVQPVESLEFWQEVLAGAHDDLSPARVNAIRVAVYGCDDLSGSQDLVTALLEDPFSSDLQKEAVRTRWRSADAHAQEITLQATTAQQPGTLQLRSSWLQRFDAPVQLTELKPPTTHASGSLLDRASLKQLFAADVPIIVCNPVSTPLQDLISTNDDNPPLLSRSNSILVITATAHAAALTKYVQYLRGHNARTLFVDPTRALTALQIINVAPSSPLAVQRYQDDSEGSNIASVTQAIASAVSSASQGCPGDVVLAVHIQTTRSLLQDSLLACQSVLHRALRDVAATQDRVSELEDTAEEVKAKVAREVFAMSGKKDQEDAVQKAIREAKGGMQKVMDDLSWWKLPWRVDDIREIIGSAINRAWCNELELTLAFHAGRLASLQQSTEKSTKTLLVSFPHTSPFRSFLLENKIQQLSSAISYALDPEAFSFPLHSRREQLKWPTARLHAAAQQSVITMAGSTFGGLSVAWLGWAGQLGLLDIGMPMESAVGAGLLGAVAGVRWAVGRFEKAKKRWWQDWNRVGKGLERDLRVTLDRTMDERVLVASKAAASELRKLAEKRKDEVEELQHEVSLLEDGLRSSA